MALHAKEPLVPFTTLMHLWISLALLVFCGGGSLDVGGIQNGALACQSITRIMDKGS